MAKISPRPDKTLSAILIGNIVINLLRNVPTTLHIAVRMSMIDSKNITKQLHNLVVSCSYDEILRFKESAAVAAAIESKTG